MATFQPGGRFSATATADLTDKRYHIVKLVAGEVVLSADGADQHLGVLDNEPVAGATADVVLANSEGTFKVRLGASVSAGAFITSDEDGRAVTADEGDRAIGYLPLAGVADEIVEYIKLNEIAA